MSPEFSFQVQTRNCGCVHYPRSQRSKLLAVKVPSSGSTERLRLEFHRRSSVATTRGPCWCWVMKSTIRLQSLNRLPVVQYSVTYACCSLMSFGRKEKADLLIRPRGDESPAPDVAAVFFVLSPLYLSRLSVPSESAISLAQNPPSLSGIQNGAPISHTH